MSQQILASLGESGGMHESLAEFERGCAEGREAGRLREALRAGFVERCRKLEIRGSKSHRGSEARSGNKIPVGKAQKILTDIQAPDEPRPPGSADLLTAQ